MLRFELKKIFSRRGNRIALVLLIISTLLFSFWAISDAEYLDENADHHIGFYAAAQLRERKNEWAGPVTEEVLRRVVQENAAINATPEHNSTDITEQNKAYAKKQGFSDLRDMINRSYSRFRSFDYYRIDTLTPDEITGFYDRRTAVLRDWLYSDEANDRFSEDEKQFLIDRYDALETPMDYAYSDGWQAIMEYLPSITMISMLFLSFLVSSIFAQESAYRADAIFFSTKLGRTAGTRAKVQAGFIITSGLYWAMILLYTALVLFVLGAGGWHCPIQFWIGGWKSYCNLNFLELYLLTVFGGWLGNLVILALAMLVSARSRSAVLAVIVPFVLLFLPTFVAELNVLSHLLGLLPDRLLTLTTVTSTFDLYEFGGRVIDSIPLLFAIYIPVYLILLPLIYRTYRKKQIL